MIRLVAPILLVVIALSGTASAQQVTEGDPAAKAAIQQVIESQIAAFQRDDGLTAFAHASDGIKALFGTPDRFMRMVETSYAQIYRPRSFEFRRLLMVREEPIQEVFFVGLDLTTMLALYRMEEQPDGSWRINGVLVAESGEEAI